MWGSRSSPTASLHRLLVEELDKTLRLYLGSGKQAAHRCWPLRKGLQGALSGKVPHPDCPLASASSIGRFFSSSKSACELNYPKKKSEPSGISVSSSPAIVKRSQRNKIPWYISVIHEKVGSHNPGDWFSIVWLAVA